MKRSDAISILSNLRPTLEARGIAHVALFGSVARDQTDQRSDIDIAVSFVEHRRPDLIDLGDIQTVLEEAFAGLKVDLVVEPIRNKLLQRAVDRDRARAF